MTLAELGRGDFFGEMALLDDNDVQLMRWSRRIRGWLYFRASIFFPLCAAVRTSRWKCSRRLPIDCGVPISFCDTAATRNVNVEEAAQRTLADRAADIIAEFGGSWKFIIAAVLFFNLWVLINTCCLPTAALIRIPTYS